jgi:acetyl-CoA synthetase
MTDPSEAIAAWGGAADRLSWERPPDRIHAPSPQGGRWFPGAMLNVCSNCLDRHLAERGDRAAFHWEGEPGDRRTISYRELHAEVCALAAGLRRLGVGPGDRVALHAGLIPEAVVAMLACARLGAVHAFMAAALPADVLADRLADFDPKLLLTQDGSWRHGVMIPLKARADEAMAAAAAVERTVVVRRTGVDVSWYEGDLWYDELIGDDRSRVGEEAHPPAVASDHPLLVAYIAGRRGQPTGILHGSAGLLTAAATIHADGLSGGEEDVLWFPVDIAWIAGQAHAVYGPLACGATSVIFEGMLDTPTHDRAWEIIERYGVTTFFTTPSVVRNLGRWSDSPPSRRELGSLRHIVTGGESIEPDLRDWLKVEMGGGSALVCDGWGQTELGGVVTLTDTPSGPDALPDPGVEVVDAEGRPLAAGVEGELVLTHPWAGAFQGIWNDDGSAVRRYWERYPGAYATGDRAIISPDGSLGLRGRIDPVVSVSGQLVSLTEVREALLEHPFVEAAEVIDCPDRRSGHAIVACVFLRESPPPGDELARTLRVHARERLGGLAQPRTVAFVEECPDDLPRDLLRSALEMLCAADSSESLSLSAAQIRAAAAGLRGS